MGKTPPPGMDINLHPIGIAAWFGFLATAFNLLPVGQLDGGHVSYALFGRFHKKHFAGIPFLLDSAWDFLLAGMAALDTVLLFIGFRHPVTLDDSDSAQPAAHTGSAGSLSLMFVLCFTPMPFYIN